MTTLTPERIAELRALINLATPGPYDNSVPSASLRHQIVAAGDKMMFAFCGHPVRSDETMDANASMIVAACNDLPAALDEIDQLRAQVEKMRAALAPFANIAAWQDQQFKKPIDDQEIAIEAIGRDCTRIFSTVRLMRDFRAAAEAMK